MASCRSPDWVRWHSSTNTNRLPLGLNPLGSDFFSSSTKRLMSPTDSPSSLPPNLWMSEQISQGCGVERRDQVGARLGAVDVLGDALEDLLDLLVELGAVGDDEDARVLDVLADPLGEPHHGEALARALGVPDDAALAAPDVALGGAHAEVLVVAAQLLGAGVEHDEVVDQLEEARLRAELAQRRSSGLSPGRRLLPGQVVLLGRLDGAVAQALGVVAGHDVLHGREERLDELLLLVVEVLADALGHRHVDRFSSSTPSAMPLTYRTMSGRLVLALASAALTVTSSAMAKRFRSGCFQSMSQTVSVCAPTSALTFTP
jgi:hypothetical protein